MNLGGFSAYYATSYGDAFHGRAEELLPLMPTESVDLIVTSPPSPLRKKKEYGNVPAKEYPDWFIGQFAHELWRVLKPEGSLVLNISKVFDAGQPTESLYHHELLLRLCREVGFSLAQEFYLHNSAALPAPAEWVNIRRIRVTPAVSPIWWLCKEPRCLANNREVLRPYSTAQLKVIKRGFKAARRPSGHVIGTGMAKDNGGAIPDTLISVAHTVSNDRYMKLCKMHCVSPNPARTPYKVPEFFIKFLSTPGALELDPFAGSNIVGYAAEYLGRRWVAFEREEAYLVGSRFRFPSLTEDLVP